MSPPTHYLNRTCIELATANFTFFDSAAGGNLSACSIKPPELDQKLENITMAQVCIATIKVMVIICGWLLMWQARSLTLGIYRKLRHLPSHQLHRELEDLYVANLSKKDRKAFEDTGSPAGRYPNVAFSTDQFTRKRKIFIVEDLDEEPTKEEMWKYTKRHQFTGKKATEVPSLNIPEVDGESASVIELLNLDSVDDIVVPEPAVINEEHGAGQGAAPEASSNPPPYHHSWTRYV
ncbi:uncharacterized protein LY89DRAFT_320275 [Mollisia scopiformis]|uniref:Uncharacterized protein n=1 Tax=Mollisia scopiformis TaxID=149040 RepID=A0A132B9P8_MOLSC|nr:uncharacterized protein LY89DRAFT_320275 [Mollisia scopiformis]KUJ09132.1 hypothetical protein LY89DRAFT_320275 [Mollisia scopiformis]